MSKPASPEEQGSSTRPYLIRALHEWCVDNGFTPYIAVHVAAGVQVPMEYVKNNEIVLNVGIDATSGLELGNEYISFKARFGGMARDILVPVDHVVAIYARENGQGMAFPVPVPGEPGAAPPATAAPAAEAARSGLRLATTADDTEPSVSGSTSAPEPADEPPTDTPPPGGPRPALKRVK
ncbi:ClpXP protease specificity-enhancing factor [Aquabacterium sp. OR-4]|uniref:ClpXP protease specificity-enhancing factor n=1 Tax=Aquabacterium sp. OR-4 TaxID=2978127 RepID=UPI0021B15BE4|nr:ClpXP protease specificity-enhancing factor [Aquabacterium sp. OR-4]MDT7835947.1 ClpXP protease specificity-enhancing factor [Aquabacterium sp. OR-4]